MSTKAETRKLALSKEIILQVYKEDFLKRTVSQAFFAQAEAALALMPNHAGSTKLVEALQHAKNLFEKLWPEMRDDLWTALTDSLASKVSVPHLEQVFLFLDTPAAASYMQASNDMAIENVLTKRIMHWATKLND